GCPVATNRAHFRSPGAWAVSPGAATACSSMIARSITGHHARSIPATAYASSCPAAAAMAIHSSANRSGCRPIYARAASASKLLGRTTASSLARTARSMSRPLRRPGGNEERALDRHAGSLAAASPGQERAGLVTRSTGSALASDLLGRAHRPDGRHVVLEIDHLRHASRLRLRQLQTRLW